MTPPVESSRDGHVGVLRLESPETRNALTAAATEALAEGLEAHDRDPEVRCIVLGGTREVFASGTDMRAGDGPGGGEPEAAEFWRRLAAIETPIVAAVSGFALGAGCELALACDMVVASDTSHFGQPEITLGAIPGGGATQRLTRAMGKQLAMEHVLTGRRFDAETGVRFGLVNRVSKRRRWLEEAVELARTVAERPPVAARLAKRAVLAAEEKGLTAGLEEERALRERALETEDRVEAVRAFAEKREPRFRGR